jgi:hypothetical protein
LIADDNRDAADTIAMLLELSGHELRVAHDGRTALSLAQVFSPDPASPARPERSADGLCAHRGSSSC